jgi:hypothetical protein
MPWQPVDGPIARIRLLHSLAIPNGLRSRERCLINDIHKKHILGRTIAGIYVIEFQKHGLSHAHIFIFFAKDYKPHTVEDVDRMINVELLNLETNMLAHEMVARCMMHGPCRVAFPNAPCMEKGKCKKQYPCKF